MIDNTKKIIGGAAAISLIMLGITIGFSAARVMAGIFVLWASSYFILKPLSIGETEKIIFSFLLGIGIFPGIVYWTAFIIGMKMAIVVASVVFVGAALLMNTRKVKGIISSE